MLVFLFWDRVFLIAQDGPKFTILLSQPPSAGMTGTHNFSQPNMVALSTPQPSEAVGNALRGVGHGL